MGEEVKEYLNKMIKTQDCNVFVFRSFYDDPKKIFNNVFFDKLKDDIKFYEFIILCFEDIDFREKIKGNYEFVSKINELVNEKNNNNISDWIEIIERLEFELNIWFDLYREEYIVPKILEEKYLKMLKERKFLEVLNQVFSIFVVEDMLVVDGNSFKAIVCSNKILKFCDEELITYELSLYEIEKFIELLEMSIDVATLDLEEEYIWCYEIVGEERANEYNVDLASSVIGKLEEKIRNTKVLELY